MDPALAARLAAILAQTETPHIPKHCNAYTMMCNNPEKWFRDAPIDERDRALLTGVRENFLEYSSASYLRKMYHMKRGGEFEHTDWTVENDDKSKNMIRGAGGQLVGFDGLAPAAAVDWVSMKVCVNVKGTLFSGFDWGFLSTKPTKTRIFKGPAETCATHPWDAMILRDCTPSTHPLLHVDYIADHYWDILLMKMCEDYDSPWVVVSVKDAGPYDPSQHTECYAL